MTGEASERQVAVVAFIDAAEWLEGLTKGIAPKELDQPALGEWSLRELVAHTSRAVSVVEEYYRPFPPDGRLVQDDYPLRIAGADYASAMGNPGLHSEVAERGRREAVLIGDDPRAEVAARVQRAVAIVKQAPEGAVFETRFSTAGFASYLCTRTVELVVHGVDICSVLRMESRVPERAARVALAVLAEIALHRGESVPVVRALAGRAPLPAHFGLFS